MITRWEWMQLREHLRHSTQRQVCQGTRTGKGSKDISSLSHLGFSGVSHLRAHLFIGASQASEVAEPTGICICCRRIRGLSTDHSRLHVCAHSDGHRVPQDFCQRGSGNWRNVMTIVLQRKWLLGLNPSSPFPSQPRWYWWDSGTAASSTAACATLHR